MEGNLGLRISDIIKLRPCDIVRDGDRFRLEIVEQKTGKRRVFTVPLVIAQYVENYCLRNGIGREDLIFPITERAVQKQLAIVCDYLGLLLCCFHLLTVCLLDLICARGEKSS